MKKLLRPFISKAVLHQILRVFYKKRYKFSLIKNDDKKNKNNNILIKKEFKKGNILKEQTKDIVKVIDRKRMKRLDTPSRGIYLSKINEIVGRLSKLKRKEKQQLMDILFYLNLEGGVRHILGEQLRLTSTNVQKDTLLEHKAMLLILQYIDEFFFIHNFMEEIFEAEGDLYFDFNIKQKEWSNPQIDFDFGLFFRYSIVYPLYSVILCLLPYSIIELIFSYKDGSRSLYNLFRVILYVPLGIFFNF